MVTYGTNPGMGMPITRRVPGPDGPGRRRRAGALEHALEYMDLTPASRSSARPVDVVFIGSCTNSRISDLRLAAGVLARPPRRRRRPGAWSCPASPQVKAQAEREGLDEVFRAAGAEWREAGCSMCIAMNGDQGAPGQYIVSAPATATSRVARARAPARSSPRR